VTHTTGIYLVAAKTDNLSYIAPTT